MPFSFKLSANDSVVKSGEKIEFTLRFKNCDKENTYPLLIPGNQNYGKKIIYFRVFFQSENLFVPIATEDRETFIIRSEIFLPEMAYLKPNEEISIPLIWNDMSRAFSHVEAHHFFNQALIAGTFCFQAFYNPYASCKWDTIYNYYSMLPSDLPNGRLAFPIEGVLSNPCKVRILPNYKPEGVVLEEGIAYTQGRAEEGKGNYYVNDSILAFRISVGERDAKNISRLQSNYKNHDPGSIYESVQWRDKNFVQSWYFYDKNRCPSIYFGRRYYPDNEHFWIKTDTLANGDMSEVYFNREGKPTKENLYYEKGKKLKVSFYNKEGTKVKTIRFYDDPCKVIELFEE